MDISGKVWGTTSKIFAKNNIEVYRITGKKGGFSSMHKHKMKWSMFFVEKGSILVEVRKNDYDLVDVTELGHGQSMRLRPGEYHRFRVVDDDTIAYEFYWTELDPDDIEREDCGGTANL